MLNTWRQMRPRARREVLEGYLGISPWLIGFLLFTLGPILASLYFSMTQWNIVETPRWIGFANYVKLLTDDPLFTKALQVTLTYVALAVPLQLVTNLIDAFQVFTSVYIITGGGPLRATWMYMLYLYEQAFQEFNMGYASALAWILTIIIVVLSVVVFRTSNRWVYYEDTGEKVQ